MLKKKLVAITLAVIISSIALLSCQGKTALENRVWTLESYSVWEETQTVLSDTEITLEFNSDEGKVSGSAGCNDYFADYHEELGSFISIGHIGSTRMHCDQPRGIIVQEQKYLEVLQKAERYVIQGGKLNILSSASQVLVFSLR